MSQTEEGRIYPKAPEFSSLPQPVLRAHRNGPQLRNIEVRLSTVTPILGGSSQTREIDEVDIIRPATVRGHLRFWWRALYAGGFPQATKLYERESAIWGTAVGESGGRSMVEIRVDVEAAGQKDDTDINLQRTPGAYALWPARSKNRGEVPPIPRRKPGIRFRLTLLVAAEHEAEAVNALRAWILFGGYGSRTRRGLGSLTVGGDKSGWLPTSANVETINALFGKNVLSPLDAAKAGDTPLLAGDTPLLAGATLHVGQSLAADKAETAWTTALDWLKEFRQGTIGNNGQRAREPGSDNRPGISNWPEADKMRYVYNKTSSHKPNHNAALAWPRAGFGLPIVGQFQTTARDGGRYDEPPNPFEFHWLTDDGKPHDRLGSALIVKALPLADGRFVPCALWLNRAYPAGEVILKGNPRTAAPFDKLVADGDTPRFQALAGKTGLKQAFFDWLKGAKNTVVVSP